MDALVERCTSENNTQEDWDTVIEICDKVNRDSSLGRQVVNLIIKKLSHRNLNVVLYSLTLANSVVQNCSTTVKQEISSRSFLQPLVKMLHGNVHVTVRNRILNLIQTWTDDFKGQPSLDYINQVYKDLKQEGFEFPVNVPSPKRAAANQKEKEEEEFQLALAMSLSENQPAQVLPKATAQEQTPIQPKRSEKQSIFQVRALYDFDPTDAGELALKKGDVINVHDNTTYPDWWKGSIGGEIGIFPANYVEKITSGEAKNQFGGVIEVDENEYLLRNLEAVRLLRKQIAEADPLGHDSAENDRIQADYQKIVELVPVVIKKANAKRKEQDELTDLLEAFTASCKSYEKIMNEYSMATRPQIPATYHQGAPTYSAAGQLPNWAPNQHYQIAPSPNPPITQYQPPSQQPPGNPQMYYLPRY